MNFKPYLIVFSGLFLCLSCSSDDLDREEILQNECQISQGISPNQDGFNDNFDLSCLADRTGISTLEIFDRNGVKIYEQSNYIDQFVGQDDDGDDLVTGAYFYAITFDGDDPEFGSSLEGSLYINVEQ